MARPTGVLNERNKFNTKKEIKAMYRMMKTDLWGNQIPVMDIQSKVDADEFYKRHRHVVTGVLRIPNKQSTLLQ